MLIDCQSAPLGTGSNYFAMRDDIERMYQGTLSSNFDQWHRTKLSEAKDRIKLEYCAHRLYLWLLFDKFPKLTPQQYLEAQLYMGVDVVAELVKQLPIYISKTGNNIDEVIKMCNQDLYQRTKCKTNIYLMMLLFL
jgi:hypothetical protein